MITEQAEDKVIAAIERLAEQRLRSALPGPFSLHRLYADALLSVEEFDEHEWSDVRDDMPELYIRAIRTAMKFPQFNSRPFTSSRTRKQL